MLVEMDQLRGCLTSAQQREGVLLVALAVIAGASEFVTIGALVPFLALVLEVGDEPMVGAITLQADWLPAGLNWFIALAGLIIGCAIFAAAIRLALVWRSERFCAKLGSDLVSAIFLRVMREDIASFDQRNSSEVLAGVDKVQGVVNGFVQPLLAAATNAIIALCLFALLMVIAPALTLALSVFLALIYAVISVFSVPHIRRYSTDMAQGWGERTRLLRESLGAKREIMLSRSLEQFEAAVTRADRQFRDAQSSNQAFAKSPRALFQPGVIVLLVAGAGLAVWMGVQLSVLVPALAGIALAMQRLLPLAQGVWNGLVQATGNRELVRDVVRLHRLPLADEPNAPMDRIRITDGIECREIGFSYPDGTCVLDGVSLSLKRGEWIGISGPSGAGKSTLLDVLVGLRQPTNGAVEVDGTALDAERKLRWQSAAAYVSDANFLLDGSIADNICFGVRSADRSKERLHETLQIAGLSELVDVVEGGVEAVIGESGVRLSAGQRQRIAIARALYREPAVLILDEATNAIDVPLEQEIFAAIGKAMPDLTLILVSHRTQSMRVCGRRFELASGRLTEMQAASGAGDRVVPLAR